MTDVRFEGRRVGETELPPYLMVRLSAGAEAPALHVIPMLVP